MLQDLSWVQ